MSCAAVLLVRLPPPLPVLHPGKRGVKIYILDGELLFKFPNFPEIFPGAVTEQPRDCKRPEHPRPTPTRATQQEAPRRNSNAENGFWQAIKTDSFAVTMIGRVSSAEIVIPPPSLQLRAPFVKTNSNQNRSSSGELRPQEVLLLTRLSLAFAQWSVVMASPRKTWASRQALLPPLIISPACCCSPVSSRVASATATAAAPSSCSDFSARAPQSCGSASQAPAPRHPTTPATNRPPAVIASPVACRPAQAASRRP